MNGLKTWLLAGLWCLAAARPGLADGKFDWDAWRRIPVLDGGRVKPLDTLASETMIEIAGRAKVTPERAWVVSAGDIDWPKLAALLTTETSEGAASAAAAAWFRSRFADGDLKARIAKLDWDVAKRATRLRELKPLVARLQAAHTDADGVPLSVPQLKARLADDKQSEALLEEVAALTEALDQVDALAAHLVVELNDALARPDFYQASAAEGITLPNDLTQALAKVSSLAEWERARAHRQFLSLALPNVIRPLNPAAPKDGTVVIEPRRYDPVELYVRLLLTWQGWDTVKDVRQMTEGLTDGSPDEAYWRFQKPDVWDAVPLLNARYQAMAPKLKPELNRATSVRSIHENVGFHEWIREIRQRQRSGEAELTPVEEKAMAVANASKTYAALRLGFHLRVGADRLPSSTTSASAAHGSEGSSASSRPIDWMPLAGLLVGHDLDYDAPAEVLSRVREGFYEARRGLLQDNAAQFNAGTARFVAALAELGDRSTLYPKPEAMAREVHYNRFQPFLWTTVLAGLATAILAISMGVSSRMPYVLGFATLLAAMGMMVYGTYLRIAISGRPPVTNMYETIVWSAFVASALAVTLGLVYRHRIIPLTASGVLTLATLLAYFLPIEYGKAISPLMPVLRSNYWLIVHVMTIVASYGAFMQAWALGNVGLAFYLFGKARPEIIKPMVVFTYRSIQVGVLLLAAGTILGGWWAAESWGRFWGWDPKEVWALIALIGYLIILHARFAGLVKQFGVLAGAVLAFAGVVMAWYGVNFVLGVGLHAYAFGTGGLHYVISAVLLNLAYVGAAAYAYEMRGRTAVVETKPEARGETFSLPNG